MPSRGNQRETFGNDALAWGSSRNRKSHDAIDAIPHHAAEI
jgi:hypothetical protein